MRKPSDNRNLSSPTRRKGKKEKTYVTHVSGRPVEQTWSRETHGGSEISRYRPSRRSDIGLSKADLNQSIKHTRTQERPGRVATLRLSALNFRLANGKHSPELAVLVKPDRPRYKSSLSPRRGDASPRGSSGDGCINAQTLFPRLCFPLARWFPLPLLSYLFFHLPPVSPLLLLRPVPGERP